MTTTTPGKVPWFKEPLLHFAVLAGLLFLINYLATERQKEEIVVSQQTIDFLIKQREDLELRTLSPEERQETVDQFIEDEILYSEAYNRGLDRGDSRMRRNLILKMRGLLAGEISDPSKEQLRAWYEENPERFTISEAWSVEQVFFSEPEAIPETLLDQLNAGLEATTVGEERLNIWRKLPNAGKARLVDTLGPDGARALLAAEAGRWIGPIESPFGIHFARVTDYRPALRQPYEAVAHYLSDDWMLEHARQRVEREVAGLRDDFAITIEGSVQ